MYVCCHLVFGEFGGVAVFLEGSMFCETFCEISTCQLMYNLPQTEQVN